MILIGRSIVYIQTFVKSPSIMSEQKLPQIPTSFHPYIPTPQNKTPFPSVESMKGFVAKPIIMKLPTVPKIEPVVGSSIPQVGVPVKVPIGPLKPKIYDVQPQVPRVLPFVMNPPPQFTPVIESHIHHSNRGNLPRESVDVLRKWLNAHFDHPYPNDIDKDSLAKETGLTLTQINNWFINSRRRVWKPSLAQKDGKDKTTPSQNKIALYPGRHEEEKPSKRSKLSESDSEDDSDPFARQQRENQLLKSELAHLQRSLSSMVKDFSGRNENLIKQVSELERHVHRVESANQDLLKKMGEHPDVKAVSKPIALKGINLNLDPFRIETKEVVEHDPQVVEETKDLFGTNE